MKVAIIDINEQGFMQGWRGEQCVIFDDIRPGSISYAKVLKLTHPHRGVVNIKNGEGAWTAKYVFFTSPFTPEEVFDDRVGCKDSISQFLRRLKWVTHFTVVKATHTEPIKLTEEDWYKLEEETRETDRVRLEREKTDKVEASAKLAEVLETFKDDIYLTKPVPRNYAIATLDEMKGEAMATPDLSNMVPLEGSEGGGLLGLPGAVGLEPCLAGEGVPPAMTPTPEVVGRLQDIPDVGYPPSRISGLQPLALESIQGASRPVSPHKKIEWSTTSTTRFSPKGGMVRRPVKPVVKNTSCGELEEL